ncbi:Alpha/beta hydrolase family protein [Novipirellula aureliae]|uniref:Alpha/beta hydrolase family protein n=1 Tax=Novipirellula aureliae TaxID=2527966 RepID=A0A5C6DM36_9BACT|nr:dienelactone hydrolase family protein [Novipirellula aureliae]TWU37692.1 Alpha/beta hydrolase family protein [Novipirellula aureliae]
MERRPTAGLGLAASWPPEDERDFIEEEEEGEEFIEYGCLANLGGDLREVPSPCPQRVLYLPAFRKGFFMLFLNTRSDSTRVLLLLAFVCLSNASFGSTTNANGEAQNPGATDDPITMLEVAVRGNVELSQIREMSFAEQPLSRQQAELASKLLWDQYQLLIRRNRAEEMRAKKIVVGEYAMPFDYKVFGEQPSEGRSLYISMHGGGGTAAIVNDSQWENQKRLYQPKEGVYVAPRAPTDSWNMWHQAHVDTCFARLIENMIVFENVDPNRVSIMGYSAGGDGVYQLAPRMADRWAAAAMMAGHPNNASPLSLRNIGFTIHVGQNDNGFHRNEVAAKWSAKLAELHSSDPKGYKHYVEIHQGKGHWMDRQDAVALDWMAKFTRNLRPEKVVWKQSGVFHHRFYWLAVDESQQPKNSLIVATHQGQSFDIETEDVKRLTIRMDDSMIDFDQPITITAGEKVLYEGRVTRTLETLIKTLTERGDPNAVFSAEVAVTL